MPCTPRSGRSPRNAASPRSVPSASNTPRPSARNSQSKSPDLPVSSRQSVKFDPDSSLLASHRTSRVQGRRSYHGTTAHSQSECSDASLQRRSTIASVAARKSTLMVSDRLGDASTPAPVSCFLPGEPDEWVDYEILFNRIGVKTEEDMIRMQAKVFLQLEKCRAELGPTNMTTLDSQYDLAILLKARGNIADSEANFKSVIEHYDAQLGSEHPKTISTAKNIALIEALRGNLAESQTKFEKVLAVMEKVYGEGSRSCLSVINHIANLERMRKLSSDSEKHYKQALAGWDKLGKRYALEALNVWNNLGILQHLRNHSKRACISHKYAFDGLRLNVGPDHPLTLKALHFMGVASVGAERQEDGDVFLDNCYHYRKRVLGEFHRDTLDSAHTYGVVMTMGGDYEKAEEYLLIAYKGRKHKGRELLIPSLESLEAVATVCRLARKLEKAEAYFRKCTLAHQQAEGDFHIATVRCRHLWAELLLENNKRDLGIEQLEITLKDKSKIYGPEHHELLATKHLLESIVGVPRTKKHCCIM